LERDLNTLEAEPDGEVFDCYLKGNR